MWPLASPPGTRGVLNSQMILIWEVKETPALGEKANNLWRERLETQASDHPARHVRKQCLWTNTTGREKEQRPRRYKCWRWLMAIIYSKWDGDVPVEKAVQFGAISSAHALSKQSMPTLLTETLVLPWWEQNPSFSKIFLCLLAFSWVTFTGVLRT